MTITLPTAPRITAAPLRLVTAGLVVLAVVQLVALATIDPVRATVSDLVYAPGGAWLFPLSGALTVAGSVMLALRAHRSGNIRAAGALAVWCLALTMATLFPTDPPGLDGISTAAQIHRWAAAVMFVAAPVAGWFAASCAPATWSARLRSRSIWCAVTGVVQFAFSLPSLLPVSASWPFAQALFEVRGLAERVLFVAMIAVIAAMCHSLDRSKW